jgi:hypothetical protein
MPSHLYMGQKPSSPVSSGTAPIGERRLGAEECKRQDAKAELHAKCTISGSFIANLHDQLRCCC